MRLVWVGLNTVWDHWCHPNYQTLVRLNKVVSEIFTALRKIGSDLHSILNPRPMMSPAVFCGRFSLLQNAFHERHRLRYHSMLVVRQICSHASSATYNLLIRPPDQREHNVSMTFTCLTISTEFCTYDFCWQFYGLLRFSSERKLNQLKNETMSWILIWCETKKWTIRCEHDLRQ